MKKIFLSLFLCCITAICTQGQVTKLYRITKLSQIIDGNQYVITTGTQTEAEWVFVASTNKKPPLAKDLKSYLGDYNLALWTINKNGDNYKLSQNNNRLGYLSGTNIALNNKVDLWTIQEEKGNFKIINTTSSDRNIALGITQNQFKNYASSNTLENGYVSSLTIYATQDPGNIETENRTVKVRLGGKQNIGTFYADFAVAIPEGINVYAIQQADNRKVLLQPYKSIDSTLPANTPFILQGSSNSTITLEETSVSLSATYTIPEHVHGTTQEISKSSDDQIFVYTLGYAAGHAGDADYFGFYPYTGGTLPANKIYFTYVAEMGKTAFQQIASLEEIGNLAEIVLVNKDKTRYSTKFNVSKKKIDSEVKAATDAIPNDANKLIFKKVGTDGYTYTIQDDQTYLTTQKLNIEKGTDNDLWKISLDEKHPEAFVITKDKLETTGRSLSYDDESSIKNYTYMNTLYLYKKTITNASPLSLDFTGITSIHSGTIVDDSKPIYYDLQGRIVTNPQKGIYILNGQKIIRK